MPILVASIAAAALIFAAVIAARQLHVWWKYRGQRVVTCPETRNAAGVVVDARHAAATGLFDAPELRLSSCSRWPERKDCGQLCLSQVAAAPEDCLIRNILTKWYEGEVCAFCGRPFGMLEWGSSRPALLLAKGLSVEWSQIAADKLPDTLAIARPVCFACHMANTMVREHPELVTDRSSQAPGR